MKGTIAMFFAPLDEKSLSLLVVVLIFMVLDIVVGTAKAFVRNDFRTSVMREGIYHKASLLTIMLLGWLCDTVMMHVPELGLPQMILFGCCLIIFFMELGSILENLVAINPELGETGLLSYFTTKVDTGTSESVSSKGAPEK